ncbi:hypothetical protein [Mycolicibacterium aubagnense]
MLLRPVLIAGLWLCAALAAVAAVLVDLRWAVPAALIVAPAVIGT